MQKERGDGVRGGMLCNKFRDRTKKRYLRRHSGRSMEIYATRLGSGTTELISYARHASKGLILYSPVEESTLEHCIEF